MLGQRLGLGLGLGGVRFRVRFMARSSFRDLGLG